MLWPYTQLAEPRLSLNDDYHFIEADTLRPPVKIGYMNRHGWLGYLVGGVFFVKHIEAQPSLPHPDFGCNTESYYNDRFIEIETVGPLTLLAPGQAADPRRALGAARRAGRPADPSGCPRADQDPRTLKELFADVHSPVSPGFLWGSATASYQIKPYWQEDGKSKTLGSLLSHARPYQRRGHGRCGMRPLPPLAGDSIALMRSLGLQAYRFSTTWPRILPDGYGKVNQAGLDFYSRLTDGLLEAGIEPYVTLYHWDLPQVLQDRGGWPPRLSAQAFVEYADAVARAAWQPGEELDHPERTLV